jgi:hypothetical protein
MECYCFGPPVKGCPTHDKGVTIELSLGSVFDVANVIAGAFGAFEDAYLDREMKAHLKVQSDDSYPFPFAKYGRLSFYEMPPKQRLYLSSSPYDGYVRWEVGPIAVVLWDRDKN